MASCPHLVSNVLLIGLLELSREERTPGGGLAAIAPSATVSRCPLPSSCPSELTGKATDFCRMSLAFLPGHV